MPDEQRGNLHVELTTWMQEIPQVRINSSVPLVKYKIGYQENTGEGKDGKGPERAGEGAQEGH